MDGVAPVAGRSVVPVERPTRPVSARRLLRAPVGRRFWADRCYAGLSFLLARPCFAFVVVAVILGLGLSLSFAGMLIGLPLLMLSLQARWLGPGGPGRPCCLARLRLPAAQAAVRAGRDHRLTAREGDVLALMAEGQSNGAIAGDLVISERAVEKHVSNIFSKLGLAPSDAVHRRVRAVLRYLES
jgi:DNA-binding CsgD family transcriptional regulator